MGAVANMQKRNDSRQSEQHSFAQSVATALVQAFSDAERLNAQVVGKDDPLPRRIVIGLSGGIDSTALVTALNAVASQLQLQLHACHVNHGLRGQESYEDELFCLRLCELLAVEFHAKRLPPNSSGTFSEASLREQRYRCLIETAGEVGSSLVAVAHTRDDQVETLLFRLFRGTSLSGVVGMERTRMLTERCALLRPMLALSRRDCLEFLAASELTARQDSSNADTTFSRNFIRHEIIPLIESRFPGVRDRLTQFRSIAEDEDQLLRGLAQEAYAQLESKAGGKRWHGFDLIQYAKAIRRRALSLALEQRDVEVTFERIETLLDMVETGAETGFSLDGQWEARIDANGDLVWLSKLPGRVLAPTAVRFPGITLIPAISMAFKIETYGQSEAPPSFPHQRQLEALVDLSGVKSLELRQRRPGDLIQPFGMNEQVRLKQFLRTHKCDDHSLALSGLLLADQHEVLWVPGVGLSEKLRVSSLPTHKLSWMELSSDIGVYA